MQGTGPGRPLPFECSEFEDHERSLPHTESLERSLVSKVFCFEGHIFCR